jgi:hypothetical protein
MDYPVMAEAHILAALSNPSFVIDSQYGFAVPRWRRYPDRHGNVRPTSGLVDGLPYFFIWHVWQRVDLARMIGALLPAGQGFGLIFAVLPSIPAVGSFF